MSLLKNNQINSVLVVFLKKNISNLLMLGTVLFLEGCFTFYSPIITRNITDGAINGLNHTLMLNLCIIAALGISATAANFGNSLLITQLGLSLGYLLRAKVFNKAISRWQTEITTGDLISRVTNDCLTLTQFIVSTVPAVILNLLTLLVNFFMLFWFDWLLGLITVITFPILFFLAKHHAYRIVELSRDEREQSGLMMHFVQYVLNSLAMIIGARMQMVINEKYDTIISKYNEISLNVSKKKISGQALISFVNMIQQIVFFSVGIASVAGGRISIGTLFAINALCSKVMGQASFFARLPLQWSQVSVSLERIVNLFQKTDDVFLMPQAGDDLLLVVDNIHLINNSSISFSCRNGNFMGIRGQTGSGKTTLALKIAGLLPVNEGLLHRGLAVEDIIFIPANRGLCPVLSLRENIHPSCSDTDLERMLDSVGMKERWREANLDFDSDLTELVAQLSSGEQQRLALGRAFVKIPRLLILDEAISNIDFTSAEIILRALAEQLLCNGAIVLISHRESDFFLCDTILDMPQRESEGNNQWK